MKGIPFSTDSVRAIMEDRKTQTRRLIKPQPAEKPLVDGFEYWHWIDVNGVGHDKKPRYQVGEVVYVREAWRLSRWILPNELHEDVWIFLHFKDATSRKYCFTSWPKGFDKSCRIRNGKGEWQSPLFMPAWAARLFVQITAVRAERLQEITEEDAVCEGDPKQGLIASENDHVTWYKGLWDSINDKGSPFDEHPNRWQINPWVWVYTFKQVEKP